MSSGPRHTIPSVNELLNSPQLKGLADRFSRWKVVSTVRAVLDEVAGEVHSAASEKSFPHVAELAERISRRVAAGATTPMRALINATGVLLDPALGGPPLADAAVGAGAELGQEFVDLQLDLEQGRCRRRASPIEGLLRELTGAEAAAALNNNAAATMATLAALAPGAEVLVSRGQLVEIGHHFRLPEAVAASGAVLREVGTTNKTRVADYEAAFTGTTAAVLVVYPWNYAVSGQTAWADVAELAAVARRRGAAMICNLGPAPLTELPSSAALRDLPVVTRCLEKGAELVLLDGDGLLGGPAGTMILGRRELVSKIERHPLARAMRLEKPAMVPLAATLQLHLDRPTVEAHLPILQLIGASEENLKNRAERLAPQLGATSAVGRVEVVPSTAWLMAEGIPSQAMPGWGISIEPAGGSVDALAASLRRAPQPVVAKVRDDRLLLDLRGVLPRQDRQLAEALQAASPGD